MTQVNGTNAVVGENATTVDFDTIKAKESLAAVLSAMTKKDITVENLGNQKISESILYAALVHKRLSEIEPDSAQRLLNNIRTRTKQNIKDNKNQPLFQAVDAIMQRMTTRGRISKVQHQNIKKDALGRAQLDAKSDHLRYKNVRVKTTTDEQGNIDAVLEKAAANSPASKKDSRLFKNRIESHPSLTNAQAKTRWKLLTNFKPEEIKLTVTPTETKTESPEKSKTPPVDNIKPVDPPDAKDNLTGPADFAYYPEKYNGNLSVHIPLRYTEQVYQVRILNGLGEELAQLRFLGQLEKREDKETKDGKEVTIEGKDGRAVWAWDKPASELPDKEIVLELSLIDGSILEYSIKADQFYQRTVGM